MKAAVFNQDLSSWDVSNGTSFVSTITTNNSSINTAFININQQLMLLIKYFIHSQCTIDEHVQSSSCIQPRLEQLGCIQGY